MGCLLALCLQLGLGMAHANQQGCGIWYMCGSLYPHEISISSLYVELGVDKGNWRTLVSYDGRNSVQGVVGPQQDGTFNAGSFPGCNGQPSPTCPATHFNGAGKEQTLCEEYIIRLGQSWRVEAGPCLYHVTWNETVPDYAYYGFNGSKFTISSNNYSSNKWNPGAVVGAGYGFTPNLYAGAQIKMCELRGIDPNGNNMPSICRQVMGEAGIRLSF